jgi:hypothetical protein
MSKLIIVFIVVVIIGLGYWIFQPASTPEEIDDPEIIEQATIFDIVLADNNSEIIELSAVDGSDSSGEAYRLIRDGKLYHIVIADLPEPPEGNKYEGWLVYPDPLEFFSTGVMEKNDQGQWTLEYVGDSDSLKNYRATITLETIIDGIPEKHIIEGDFSN